MYSGNGKFWFVCILKKNDIYTLMGNLINLDFSKSIFTYRWDKFHYCILNVINQAFSEQAAPGLGRYCKDMTSCTLLGIWSVRCKTTVRSALRLNFHH